MENLFLLLSPRILALKNSLIRSESGLRNRTIFMVLTGMAFWALMFIMSSRVLEYFRSTEIIGDLLAHHLLAMIFLTFFGLLVFSNIITSLSNLYLSSDLELCHSSPSSLEELFVSRAVNTMIDSSWMVIVFGLPVMMAYAWVYRPGILFYVDLVHSGLGLSITASGIAILFIMIMVSIFPARKTRDILMILMIFIVIALYFLFRFLRPERLVDPDAFFSIMHYVNSLKAPDHPLLPTNWITELLWSHLRGDHQGSRLFRILLIWSTAGAFTVINVWVAERIYFTGFSRSQEAKRRRAGRGALNILAGILKRPLRGDMASILDKDIRLFFRDNSQWSQLFLLGALVVVYLYNFSVLPLERSPMRLDFLQNTIAFLNLGLAGFVLSAVSVRFIFPAISSEGRAFWIVRSSPIRAQRFIMVKFMLYVLPMLLLGEILVVVTNHLLQVTPFMMILSTVTMFFMVFGLISLGIGLGAIYPKFGHENIAQVATGFGGLIYMILSALFIAVIIIIESGPVYILFMADLKGIEITPAQWLIMVLSFFLLLIIIAFAVYKPLKTGIIALENYE